MRSVPAASFALVYAAVAACTQLDDGSDVFSVRGGSGGDEQEPSSGGARAEAGATGGAGGGGGTESGGSASGGSGGTAEVPESGGGTSSGGTDNGSGGASEVPDAGCTDPDGFNGLGCYRCVPVDLVTLQNACTSAVCTHFDESARVTKLQPDGSRPPLPAGTGGTPGSGGAPGGSGGSGGSGSGGTTGGTGHACADLASRGQVVYVTGSSAAKPFLQQIAQQVSVQNVFIVYTSTGSCVGVDAVVNGTAMKTGPAPAPALSATYWDAPGSSGTACDLPAEGVAADLGISDVFAQSCGGFELADLDALGVRDSHGPIQTMGFVVPANSRFTEISARAAFFAFGFGAESGLLDPQGAPAWNDEASLLKRSATSGTQVMLAATIGVPARSWKGKSNGSSDDVAAAIHAASTSQESADKALGILAADYIDTKNLRATIRTLAFQDDSQACAFYPDSTASARDKANVRDGHYPVWGPMHLLYRVDGSGRPANPATRDSVTNLVGFLAGTKSLPNNVKLIDVYAQSGLVPECAMHVSRTQDGGRITPEEPKTPCSCAFDARAVGSTTCTPCIVQGDCAGTETCSLGYCEPARPGR